jgi:hypothetical protein
MADGAEARGGGRARQRRQRPTSGRESEERDAGIRLNEAFLKDVLSDWEAHGAAAIASARVERPHDYLKLVTGLIPKALNVKVNALDELSDEQLAGQLAAALAQLAAAGAGPGAGAGATEPAEPPQPLPPV